MGPKFNKYVSWGFMDGSIKFQTLLLSTTKRKFDEVLAVHESLHEGAVTCVVLTEDGQTLVSGGDDGVVGVWRMHPVLKYRDLMLVGYLRDHSAPLTALAVSSTYRLLVSASQDRSVCVWDLNRLTLTRRLPTHPQAVSLLAINDVTGWNRQSSFWPTWFLTNVSVCALSCRRYRVRVRFLFGGVVGEW